MIFIEGRRAASGQRVRGWASRIFLLIFLACLSGLLVPCARAVVVRGRVTDALGKAVPNARVQLIEKGKVEAIAYAGPDGSYEIRSSESGRFTLLGSAGGFLPAIGQEFYGGATDVIARDVVLSAATVQQDVSVTATAIPTPLPQLTAPVSVLPEQLLSTKVGVIDTLRQAPGVFMAQSGQAGGVTSLFLRGGNSTANLVLIDGIPAEDVGGTFDYGTVSSTGIGHMEIYRGPDSAIYGTDAGAGVVSIETPRGVTLKPVVNYSGGAGTLHSWRNEVSVGGTAKKLDYFAAFSRFDTSNALPLDRYHSTTEAINAGYDFNGNTSARFTIRNQGSVQGAPGAWDFQGLATSGRQADQDLYSALTVENRYKERWHNLVRYGIARKREQIEEFENTGNLVTVYPGTDYAYTEYVGNVVTIRGANGYSATGQAQVYSGSNDDQDSNRDQLYYQSDYSFSPHAVGLFGFRYDRERGSFNDYDPAYDYTEHEVIRRTNFEYNLQFQGEVKGRFSYSLGGAVEKNHLYGIAGTPRIGLSYVPVRPSPKMFHGTRLRANVATGVQEPTLSLEYNALYTQLLQAGDTADIALYHIGPQAAERSRTYDVGVDQNILGEKLLLKVGYFHNVFDRQLEGVPGPALAQYFGLNIPAVADNPYFTAYVNSLAFRAQGAEAEVQWQPTTRVLLRGGYTYLASTILQSFSSDAVAANQGQADANPNLPNVPIGIFGPLVGARPFRRPPHTGFLAAEYRRPKYSVVLQGAFASRSDDSTFLEYEDYYGGNTLLLPNRDLDFGYAKLDLGGTYALKRHITVFAQMDNLLNDQHIGPIGYPGLPLTVRAGLKLRLGGD